MPPGGRGASVPPAGDSAGAGTNSGETISPGRGRQPVGSPHATPGPRHQRSDGGRRAPRRRRRDPRGPAGVRGRAGPGRDRGGRGPARRPRDAGRRPPGDRRRSRPRVVHRRPGRRRDGQGAGLRPGDPGRGRHEPRGARARLRRDALPRPDAARRARRRGVLRALAPAGDRRLRPPGGRDPRPGSPRQARARARAGHPRRDRGARAREGDGLRRGRRAPRGHAAADRPARRACARRSRAPRRSCGSRSRGFAPGPPTTRTRWPRSTSSRRPRSGGSRARCPRRDRPRPHLRRLAAAADPVRRGSANAASARGSRVRGP